jgi:thiol-disulfide isomerase/thioredoxin
MLRRLLLTVMMAGFVLTLQPGCGGGAKAPVAAKPDTAVQTGAICDTTLIPDSTSTAAAAGDSAQPDTQKPVPSKKVEPEPQKPKPEPEKVAEKPKTLPRMWDYGSENCIPCKTMKQILDPMMVDYKGKVDIRIVLVNDEKELTRQARIQIIPTQIFYDPDGKELFRHVGVYPRDSIVGKFKEFGWE